MTASIRDTNAPEVRRVVRVEGPHWNSLEKARAAIAARKKSEPTTAVSGNPPASGVAAMSTSPVESVDPLPAQPAATVGGTPQPRNNQSPNRDARPPAEPSKPSQGANNSPADTSADQSNTRDAPHRLESEKTSSATVSSSAPTTTPKRRAGEILRVAAVERVPAAGRIVDHGIVADDVADASRRGTGAREPGSRLLLPDSKDAKVIAVISDHSGNEIAIVSYPDGRREMVRADDVSGMK